MARETWIEKLDQGDGEAAWDLLLEQYHRLISATVRHYGKSYDDVMDMFAYVCDGLREDDFARLRKFTAIPEGQVRFTTWIVAVIRNLAIDWLRQRDGRKRLSKIVTDLPPAQRDAFELVFVQGFSHVEAYELFRSKIDSLLSFPEFVSTLAEAQKSVSDKDPGQLFRELELASVREQRSGPSVDVSSEVAADTPVDSRLMHAEMRDWLDHALETLDVEDRVAVRLYVQSGMPAAEVARCLGWQSSKTVYNHVYRSLSALRGFLVAKGVEPSDLV